MNTRDKWNLVHSYRSLETLNAVPPILCPECAGEVFPVVDTDSNPALQCLSDCGTIHLGLNVYDQMKKNIADFNATTRPAEKK